MIYGSDQQGKSIIQVLILRDWEEDRENILRKLGGIDEEGNRNEDRIRQIEEMIESLKSTPLVDTVINHDEA